MVLSNRERTDLSNKISAFLEDTSLEEFLDTLDITPEEMLISLYESGQVDPEVFENSIGI